MQSSDEEVEPLEEEESKKRGRPVGKADDKPRYRRTAQQISDDKLRIAEMKLNALRESEERKLSSKTRARRKPAVTEQSLQAPPKVTRPKQEPTPQREEMAPPQRPRRQALYDSWFPSSPRSNNAARY